MQFQGVYLEGHLPICWHTFSGEGGATVRDAINLEHMRMISGLDDYYAPSLDIDEASAISQEFQRLDAKLNVMMQMLGRLLARDIPLPLPRQVVLQSGKLHWLCADSDNMPTIGTDLEIDLYLKQQFPFPLTFAVQVSSIESGWVSCDFAIQNDELSDSIERYVFRAHRRQIAKNKKPA